MSKQVVLKDRLVRDDHVITHPVTGAYERAIRLEGNHYTQTHQLSSWTGGNGVTLRFATASSTAITAPDGSANAHRLLSAANTVYHGVHYVPLEGVGNTYQGLPGELATRQRAFQIFAKAGNLIDEVETRTYAEDGSGFTIDRFNLLTATKTSGASKIYIEPAVPNDPAYAGWCRIFSHGLRYPSSGTISNRLELYLVKGGLGYNAGGGFAGAGTEYVDLWGYSSENNAAECQSPLWSIPDANAYWGTSPGAEHLAIPLKDGLATPVAMTVYAEWLERGNAVMANAADSARESGILRIGDMPRTAAGSLEIKQTATGFTGTLNNGGTTSVSTVALAPGRNQLVALRAVITGGGVLTLNASLNGAAEVAGTTGAAAGLPATWNEATMTVNSLGASLFGDMDLLKLKVWPGDIPRAVAAA